VIRQADYQVLVELLAPRAGERVLDLGCGTGGLCAVLAEFGCRVTGLDREPVVLEQARLAAPDCEFVCAEAGLFVPEPAFDAVAALGVLHWWESSFDAARLLFRLLNPNGRAAGVCHGAGAPVMQAADLRSALRQAGFAEVEVVEHEGRLWFFAGREGDAVVA
jgi:SAM-dependent methyltransferase